MITLVREESTTVVEVERGFFRGLLAASVLVSPFWGAVAWLVWR